MTVELASIFESFLEPYQRTMPMSAAQRRVAGAVLACRTPRLGTGIYRCDHCDGETVRYCSCRNRHCPKCQGQVRAQWVEARCEDVLDVPYFHLVFTIPHELNPLARRHPRLIYGLVFEVVWYTLDTLARERLGGRLGMTAVLHTWGQTLMEHIHLHCLIPGGAFDDRAGRWQRVRSRYLFPVRVMRRMFRGRFVSRLRDARDELGIGAADLTALLDGLMAKEWSIYAKPVLGHAHQVIDYLGRYTYRIAIGHERLLAIRDDEVLFRYRDYRNGGKHRVMKLAGTEFVRRFLAHVLPRGFMRVRHFGFLGNRVRRVRIDRIRALLPRRRAQAHTIRVPNTGDHSRRCPLCELGTLQLRTQWKPPAIGVDTS